MAPVLIAATNLKPPVRRPRIDSSFRFSFNHQQQQFAPVVYHVIATEDSLVLFFEDTKIRWCTALKQYSPDVQRHGISLVPSAFHLACCTSRILLCIEQRQVKEGYLIASSFSLLSLDDGRCVASFTSPLKQPIPKNLLNAPQPKKEFLANLAWSKCPAAPPSADLMEWEYASRLMFLRNDQQFVLWDFLEDRTVIRVQYCSEDPNSNSSTSSVGLCPTDVIVNGQEMVKKMIGRATSALVLQGGCNLIVCTADGQVHVWDLNAAITRHCEITSNLVGQPSWIASKPPSKTAADSAVRVGLTDVWHDPDAQDGRLWLISDCANRFILSGTNKIYLFEVGVESSLKILHVWDLTQLDIDVFEESHEILNISGTAADHSTTAIPPPILIHKAWPLEINSASNSRNRSIVVVVETSGFSIILRASDARAVRNFKAGGPSKRHSQGITLIKFSDDDDSPVMLERFYASRHKCFTVCGQIIDGKLEGLVKKYILDDTTEAICARQSLNRSERGEDAALAVLCVEVVDSAVYCYFNDQEEGLKLRILRAVDEDECNQNDEVQAVAPPRQSEEVNLVAAAAEDEQQKSQASTPAAPSRQGSRRAYITREDGDLPPALVRPINRHAAMTGLSWRKKPATAMIPPVREYRQHTRILWRSQDWICEERDLYLPCAPANPMSVLSMTPVGVTANLVENTTGSTVQTAGSSLDWLSSSSALRANMPTSLSGESRREARQILVGTSDGHLVLYRDNIVVECKSIAPYVDSTPPAQALKQLIRQISVEATLRPSTVLLGIESIQHLYILCGEAITTSDNLCLVSTVQADFLIFDVGSSSIHFVAALKCCHARPSSVVYDPWNGKFYVLDLQGASEVVDSTTGQTIWRVEPEFLQLTLDRWQNQLHSWKTNSDGSNQPGNGTLVPKAIASDLALDLVWVRVVLFQEQRRTSPRSRLLDATQLTEINVESVENLIRRDSKLSLTAKTMQKVALSLSCYFPWDGSEKDVVQIAAASSAPLNSPGKKTRTRLSAGCFADESERKMSRRSRPSEEQVRPSSERLPNASVKDAQGPLRICQVPKLYKMFPIFHLIQSPHTATDAYTVQYTRATNLLREKKSSKSTQKTGAMVKRQVEPIITPCLSGEESGDGGDTRRYESSSFASAGKWEVDDNTLTEDPPPLTGGSLTLNRSQSVRVGEGHSAVSVDASRELSHQLSVTMNMSMEGSLEMTAPSRLSRPSPSSLWMLFKQSLISDVLWSWQTHLNTDLTNSLQIEVRKCRQYLFRCLLHNSRRFSELESPFVAPSLGLLSLASHLFVSARSISARTSASEILKQTALRAARMFDYHKPGSDLELFTSANSRILEKALHGSEKDSERFGSTGKPIRQIHNSTRSAPDMRQLAADSTTSSSHTPVSDGPMIKPLDPRLSNPLLISNSSYFHGHATMCESALFALLILNYYTLANKNKSRVDQPAAHPLLKPSRWLLSEAVVRVLSNPSLFFRSIPIWSSSSAGIVTGLVRRAVNDPYVRFKLELILDTLESHARLWRKYWLGDDTESRDDKFIRQSIQQRIFLLGKAATLTRARELEREFIKTYNNSHTLVYLRSRYDPSAANTNGGSTTPTTTAADQLSHLEMSLYMVFLSYLSYETFSSVITSLLFQCAHIKPLKLIALTSTLIENPDCSLDIIKTCIRAIGKIALKDSSIYYVVNHIVFEHIIAKAIDPNNPRIRNKLLKLIALFLWELSRVLPFVAFDKASQKIVIGALDGNISILTLMTGANVLVKTMKNSNNPVTSVALASNNTVLSFAPELPYLIVWNQQQQQTNVLTTIQGAIGFKSSKYNPRRFLLTPRPRGVISAEDGVLIGGWARFTLKSIENTGDWTLNDTVNEQIWRISGVAVSP